MKHFKRFGCSVAVVGLVGSLGIGCRGESAWKRQVRLVSLGELKASVPKELLDLPREDEAALARYRKIIVLAKSLNRDDSTRVNDNFSELGMSAVGDRKKRSVSKADQLALVKRIWKANPRLLSNLEAVLSSGPLALPPNSANEDLYNSIPLVNLIRMLAYSAVSYASFGEFTSATRLISVLYRLDDALISGGGGVISYMWKILILGITTAPAEIFAQSKFPIRSCSEIIKSVPPAPRQDRFLASAIQSRFVHDTLPDLASNRLGRAGTSSYDAIATVQAAAKASLIAMSNVRVPFSKGDQTYFKQLAQDANAVIKRIDPTH